MKKRIEQLEEWLKVKSKWGIKRRVWIALALVVGIAIEVIIVYHFNTESKEPTSNSSYEN